MRMQLESAVLQDSWLSVFPLAGVEFYSTEHSSGQTPVCSSVVLSRSTGAKETLVQRPCFAGSKHVPEQTWSLPHPDTLWSIRALCALLLPCTVMCPAWKERKGKGVFRESGVT